MDFIRTISVPLGIFLLIVFTLYSIKWLNDFFQEQMFLKNQIARCGNPVEKQHWEKNLRNFYFRKIPLIGLIIQRFM